MDEFSVVDRGGLIDLRFDREVVKRKAIVSIGYEGGARRYLKHRGWAKYRGMYKSRRKVGFERSEWTSERSEAYGFASPSAARAYLAKEFGKVRAANYAVESVRMIGVEHVTISSANMDFAREHSYFGEFKEIG